MSTASDKGKRLERDVAALLRKKLNAKVIRDSRSGAGDFHKSDIKDWYGEFPFSIEVKNQKTLKIPEWWRQAEGAAGYRRPPALVFAMDEQVLATVRLDDLVDLVAELAQQQAELQQLRAPASIQIPEVQDRTASERLAVCRNGHIISAGQTKCMWKGCPYSSAHKAKKEKS